ncbi:MAG: acyltransferase [Planctomycetota bacterium]
MRSKIARLFAVGPNLRALTPGTSHRLDILDAVRVIAFAYVVLHHCATFLFYCVPFEEMRALLVQPAFAWVLEGELSVDLFFALSGFLITEILLKEIRGSGTLRLGRFYARRFLRLAPVYYVFLGLVWVGTQPHENAHNLWVNALWLNNWLWVQDMAVIWTWSLAIEEQFYLTFPLLLLLLLKAPAGWRLGLLIGAIALNGGVFLGLMQKHGLHMPHLGSMLDLARFNLFCDALYTKPYTRYGAILIGALVAWLVAFHPRVLDLSGRRRWLQFACLGTALVASAWLLHRDQEASGWWADVCYAHHHQVAGAVAALFIVLALQREGLGVWLSRLLPAKVFMAPSHLTYTGYLIHPFVIRAYYKGFWFWPGAGIDKVSDWGIATLLGHFAVVLVVTYLLTVPLYLLVERPGMNLRDFGKQR